MAVQKTNGELKLHKPDENTGLIDSLNYFNENADTLEEMITSIFKAPRIIKTTSETTGDGTTDVLDPDEKKNYKTSKIKWQCHKWNDGRCELFAKIDWQDTDLTLVQYSGSSCYFILVDFPVTFKSNPIITLTPESKINTTYYTGAPFVLKPSTNKCRIGITGSPTSTSGYNKRYAINVHIIGDVQE